MHTTTQTNLPAHDAHGHASEEDTPYSTDHLLQDSHHAALQHKEERCSRTLTIRAHSGLSGDMMLAGLLVMTGTSEAALNTHLTHILPELSGRVRLVQRQVQSIHGWHVQVNLPDQHVHRTLTDILTLITSSCMSENAQHLARETFILLAHTEGAVHAIPPEKVHFHELGALDSILDICLACELFTLLAPARLVVSPLPLADGSVRCVHGSIPTPAPAVLRMLEGISVQPFSGKGETVTPTALALLRTLGAVFGPWPAMTVEKTALVYGTRVFPDVPNGAIFALGIDI